MTSKTKIIVTAIQKGGVGKTTIAVNLAYLFAEDSFPKNGRPEPRKPLKVDIFDIDSQCNTTSSLLVRQGAAMDFYSDLEVQNSSAAMFGILGFDDDGQTIWDMQAPLPKATPVPAVCDVYYEGYIRCIPAHKIALPEVETMESSLVFEAAERFRRYAEQTDADVVIIDCPPALGLRQITAMLAADHIITPISTDTFSEEGLEDFLQTFASISESNEGCQLHIVPNKINLKSKPQLARLEEYRESFGEYMTDSIQDTAVIVEAVTGFRPIWRKCNSGNDSLIGRKVRTVMADIAKRCGIKAQ